MKRRHFLCGLGAGVAVTTPRLLRAQQQTMPTVGVVSGPVPRHLSPFADAFVRYMKELGWEEDRNYRVFFVVTEGHWDRIPGIIAQVGELVARRVDVIVVFGDASIKAAQRATTTIPIVGMADDIVKSGLVASLAKPGGNTTGVSIFASELDVKRRELLHEAVPTGKRIGVLADSTTVFTLPQLDTAARSLALELVVVSVRNREELSRGLDALEAAHVDGVNVLASPLLGGARALIIERLNQMRLPAIYQFPEMAEAGGFLGWGAREPLAFRHVAGLVAKILRGSRPEDLPIEQPAKIDLAVNLKTAKALGLTIPPSIIARADEVIE
jgi:putative ABC transport system substrate-binding protein